MVESNLDPSTGEGTIVLKPNNSESWRVNKLLLISLALLSGMISLGFMWLGLWLVFPFSGLEMIALYAALYVCVCRNRKTEVITFERDRVIVESGRRFVERKQEYQRAWSKILVRQPDFRGHLKRIFIRSHGREQELGAFLNHSDRDRLIRVLKQAVYS